MFPVCQLGSYLGFLVSERGIEANPEKIKAITLVKPACINDVQRLAGHTAALSRFISHLGEKAIPLYQMMKNTDNFVWSDAANQAFEALKKQLAERPILAAPIDKEPLLLYVAANSRAVSIAVVVERKESGKEYPVHRPVYYLSEVLIEAKPEKIEAITSLAKPTCINDVQRLAGRIAALSRFISRFGEKSIPLYQMMKKTDHFVWSDAADQVFEALKKQLAEPPILLAPIDKEPLLLYVAANSRAVSVAIVVERKETGKEYPVQRPVYYISEVRIESKRRYPHWQKLVYGVFMASRKLKQYFFGHPITVVSSAPLGDISQNREATGRVAKWAIELGPHSLKYMPQTAIKSQALVDFINK